MSYVRPYQRRQARTPPKPKVTPKRLKPHPGDFRLQFWVSAAVVGALWAMQKPSEPTEIDLYGD